VELVDELSGDFNLVYSLTRALTRWLPMKPALLLLKTLGDIHSSITYYWLHDMVEVDCNGVSGRTWATTRTIVIKIRSRRTVDAPLK
jgi:hypothetical protein